MSLINCICGRVQTGADKCSDYVKEIGGIGFIDEVNSDGDLNNIPVDTTIGSAYFTALVNNPDETKKLFYFGDLQNANYAEADPRNKSYENGISVNIEKRGIVTFSALKENVPIQVVNKLKSAFCGNTSVYIFGTDGHIIGSMNGTTDSFYPRGVVNDSISFQRSHALNGSDKNGMIISFTEKKNTLNNSLDILTLNGEAVSALTSVQEVTFTEDLSASADGVIVLDSVLAGSSSNSPITFGYEDIADFTLTNTTASTEITIDSLVINSSDQHVFGFTGVAGNTYKLEFARNGFFALDVEGTLT